MNVTVIKSSEKYPKDICEVYLGHLTISEVNQAISNIYRNEISTGSFRVYCPPEKEVEGSFRFSIEVEFDRRLIKLDVYRSKIVENKKYMDWKEIIG
jgi:hypothetical protein